MAEETDKFIWLLVQETIRQHESAKRCQQFVQEMMWERGRVELAYINSLEKWAGALAQGISKEGSPFPPEVQGLLVAPAREAQAQANLHQKLYNNILRADGPCLQFRKRVQCLEERTMVSDTNRVYSAAVLQFQAKLRRRHELEGEVRRKKQQYEYALSASRDMNEKLDGRRRRNTPRPLSARKMETLECRQYHLQRYSDVQQSQLKEQENELLTYLKAQRKLLETMQSDLNLFYHRRLCDTLELTRMFILTLAEHEIPENRAAKKLTLDECRNMLSNVPEATLSEKMLSAVREKVLQTVMEENAAQFTLQDLVSGLTSKEGKRSTGSEGLRSRPRAPGPDTFRFRPSSPSPVCPQNISTLREDSTSGPLPNTSKVHHGGSQIARVKHLLKIQTRQEELVNEYLARTSGRQEDLVSEYLRGTSQDDLTRAYPVGAASDDDLTCALPVGAEDMDDMNSTRPGGSASLNQPTTRDPFGGDIQGGIYNTDQARSVSQNDLTNRYPVGGSSQDDLTNRYPVGGASQDDINSRRAVGGESQDHLNRTHPARGSSQNDLRNHPGGNGLANECVTSGNYRACDYLSQTAGEDVADDGVTQTAEVSDHEIQLNQQCIKNVFISYSNDSVLAKAGSPIPTTSNSVVSTQSMESLVLPPEMTKLPRHHLPFDVRNFCAENEDDEDDAMSQTERRLTSIAKGLRRKLFGKEEEVTLTQVIALAPGELLRNLKDLEDVQEDLDDLSLNSSGYSIDDQSSSSCNSSSESDEVSLMSNIRVRALHAYQARNTREISLDQGQFVKQKRGADDQGYSYGWTRAHKLAPKRYGYYPAGMVALPQSYPRKVRRYGQVEMKEPEDGDRNVNLTPLLVQTS